MQAEAPQDVGLLQSIVLGIVEGVTEFLPVSSTGHLIVANAFFGQSDPSFEIAIQAGAITAILVLYWRDLWRAVTGLFAATRSGGVNLMWLILAAAVPASVVGLLLEDTIDALLFNPITVAVALIVGGFLLIALERHVEARGELASGGIPAMTLRQAFVVGLWQCLALIPGTSRSGATIAGGLLTGMSRAAAAEFSFLVGLPILYGACVLKLASDFERMTGPLLPSLVIASTAAFISAILVVRPFVRFLQRHTFRPFAYYRVAAGVAILALIGAGII